MSKSALSFVILLLLFGVGIFMKENNKAPNASLLKEDALILAFGDSLTYGFGVDKALSYPALLAKKTGLRVVNAGVPGEESAEGLARLPKLLTQKPDVVILCHGGNDILRKLSMSELKRNLLAMVELIEQSGAKVILVGVPDFALLGFSAHSIYDEVAREKDLIYEDEILAYVESRRELKSDYVHPNAKGYEMMADAIGKSLAF